MTKKKYAGPKRRIERIRSTLVIEPVTAAQVGHIMHTCEDAKTLVRVLIDGYWTHDPSITLPDSLGAKWMVANRPNGQLVAGLTMVQALDETPPLQEIASGYVAFGGAVDEGTLGTPFYRDIKAMRKLVVGDEITFEARADVTDSIEFKGVIYLWFKE